VRRDAGGGGARVPHVPVTYDGGNDSAPFFHRAPFLEPSKEAFLVSAPPAWTTFRFKSFVAFKATFPSPSLPSHRLGVARKEMSQRTKFEPPRNCFGRDETAFPGTVRLEDSRQLHGRIRP
jgi:hypothetical protein